MVDKRFYMSAGPLNLGAVLSSDIQKNLDPSLLTDIQISNAAETHACKKGDIVFVASEKYLSELETCAASAILIRPEWSDQVPNGVTVVESNRPHEDFLSVLNVLFPSHSIPSFDSLASSLPKLEANVSISDSACIGDNVEIGEGTIVGPNVVIGHGVRIGRDCVLGPNCVVEYALLGDRVVIQAGAIVGSSGFGWLSHGKHNFKIPQLGRAILQSDVMVGPNATVDRGALGDTVLGENTKLGNGVVIGHNCQLGRNCLLAPTTGLAGTTTLGDGVVMGAGVGSSGHLTVGAGSMVYARAAVTKDWPEGSQIAGAPAQDIKDFWQELAMIRKLRRGGKK